MKKPKFFAGCTELERDGEEVGLTVRYEYRERVRTGREGWRDKDRNSPIKIELVTAKVINSDRSVEND